MRAVRQSNSQQRVGLFKSQSTDLRTDSSRNSTSGINGKSFNILFQDNIYSRYIYLYLKKIKNQKSNAHAEIRPSDRVRALAGWMLHQLKPPLNNRTVQKDQFKQYKMSPFKCGLYSGKVFVFQYLHSGAIYMRWLDSRYTVHP